MKQELLYKELAQYYDCIYSWKDYKKEVQKLEQLILKYKKSEGTTLLEVGCGTGQHLKYFKKKYRCMGVDLQPEILAVAKKNAPGVAFKSANMITLNLGKQFDVITCLFSSIGYVKTSAHLRKTILAFARHLKTGGVVIIEPWFTKQAFKPGIPFLTTYDSPTFKISRTSVSFVKGNVSIMDMHYLIAEKDTPVRHVVDRHEMGLFDTKTTLQYMKEAGLNAMYLKNGLMKERGLFVGVKERE